MFDIQKIGESFFKAHEERSSGPTAPTAGANPAKFFMSSKRKLPGFWLLLKEDKQIKIPVAYGDTKKSIILQRTKHLHRNRCAFEELVGDIDAAGHAIEEVQSEPGSGSAACSSGLGYTT